MSGILGGPLLVAGAAFMLLAAIGILRMPDVFMRMQAATKANTLGIAGLMLGAAFGFGDFGAVLRALLIIGLVYVTAPVAAHVIARAAYLTGAPVWDRTRRDEWHEKQDGHPDQAPPNPTY